MEPRNYQQIWRQLKPEQKLELSQKVDSTYGSLKCIAYREGRCGRHMARAIAAGLIDMGVVDGDIDTLLPVIFPDLVMSVRQAGAA